MRYYQVNTTKDLGAITALELDDQKHFKFVLDFHEQLMPQINPMREVMNLPKIGANVIVGAEYTMIVLYRGEWDENALNLAHDLVAGGAQ